MNIQERIKKFEDIEYKLFKFWWEDNREENPRTAITASVARNIAILIFDEKNNKSKEVLNKNGWKKKYTTR